MKYITMLVIILPIFALTITGCVDEEGPSADQIQKDKMEDLMREAIKQIGGLPSITNFKELKDAKMIIELRDQEDLVCYAYTYNDRTGKLHYQGKCLGYGLPYSSQMSNPLKPFQARVDIENGRVGNRHGVVSGLKPQPEPNGLFIPDGLSATWVMMLDSKGEPHPVYMEPELTVSPYPLPYAVYPEGVDL